MKSSKGHATRAILPLAPKPKSTARPGRKKTSDEAEKNTFKTFFKIMCESWGLPEPKSEYRFHHLRKWRFDFAWPEINLAVEIEGGLWTQGRHTRGAGFLADMEKYNEASILGYKVLRFSPQQINNGSAFPVILRAMEET